MEGLHQDAFRLLPSSNHPSRIRLVGGEGFLAQYVPPRLESGNSPSCMEAVHEGNKHSIDVIVFHELRVALIGDRDTVLNGESLGPPGVTAGHGDHVSAADLASWL